MDALAEAYDALEREYPGPYKEAFDKADYLLVELGEGDLAERIYSLTPADAEARWTGELLSILTWTTSDNGLEIRRTLESWLRDNDEVRKIAIALAWEGYPFIDREEMNAVLTSVARRFPQFAEKCEAWIESRAALNEDRGL